MFKILKFLQSNIYPVLITLICVFLMWKNYLPGTYLLGWDSLHSEFDFQIAFQRALSGVWREDQGLGTVAIHSHMADLPRIIFLFLESFFLPQSLLRYSYIFMCMLAGPLGIFYLLKNTTKNIHASFLASVYYLLNLGTLQHFNVVFEMFAVQFAFLPWLMFFTIRYLGDKSKKDLFAFAVTSLMATPMAYAATLFYAYFAALVIFLIIYVLVHDHKIINFKLSLILISVTLLVNSFWLLPNIYAVVSQGENVNNAKTNQLFSPEAFLRNKEYGDIQNVAIHKNFLFSWNIYDFENEKFKPLLQDWKTHLENDWVIVISYATTLICVFGMVVGLFKKDKIGASFLGILILCLFFLFNENYATGTIYKFLNDNFSIFNEGFRMPFTKFSILYIFTSAYYFGYFFSRIFGTVGKVKWLNFFNFIIIIGVTCSIFYQMLPSFSGKFINPIVRRNMPIEYFQLFDWFSRVDLGNVAVLPIHSPWGWEYHDWGYEGSGFISFGIKSPLHIRDFDRWSPYNQKFYEELSSAFYNKDDVMLMTVLNKYNIKYLLLDESIMNAGGDNSMLQIDRIKDLFTSLSMSEVAKFNFLSVYDTGIKVGSVNTPQTSIELANQANTDALSAIGDIYVENLTINRGFKEAYNCDINKEGVVEKQLVSGSVRYFASGNGVSCDYFSYPDLDYQKNYVLHIQGENKSGRSLKFYLFNFDSQRADLEELLPQGKFDKKYLVSAKNFEGAGYTLNVETRSFGRVYSENIISGIEIYPVDLPNQDINISPIENSLEILDVKKYGTWAYKVQVKSGGMLSLNQSFEQGWVGFANINQKWVMLEHREINGWQNGFLVPNLTNKTHDVYIFFWPQLLEFAGFGLLGITFTLLLTGFKKRLY